MLFKSPEAEELWCVSSTLDGTKSALFFMWMRFIGRNTCPDQQRELLALINLTLSPLQTTKQNKNMQHVLLHDSENI